MRRSHRCYRQDKRGELRPARAARGAVPECMWTRRRQLGGRRGTYATRSARQAGFGRTARAPAAAAWRAPGDVCDPERPPGGFRTDGACAGGGSLAGFGRTARATNNPPRHVHRSRPATRHPPPAGQPSLSKLTGPASHTASAIPRRPSGGPRWHAREPCGPAACRGIPRSRRPVAGGAGRRR
jgi:hypothetical protein